MRITREMRERLMGKRLALGLSQEALGRFLGVHTTTVCLWESGRLTACREQHAARLQAFLAGAYDRVARPLLELLPEDANPAAVPDELAEALAQLAQNTPATVKAQESLRRQLDELCARILAK